MKIISTNIGERKDINWKGKMITTGIFKFPVNASIFLDKEEVKGDTICNRKYHGGIELDPTMIFSITNSISFYLFFIKKNRGINWKFKNSGGDHFSFPINIFSFAYVG